MNTRWQGAAVLTLCVACGSGNGGSGGAGSGGAPSSGGSIAATGGGGATASGGTGPGTTGGTGGRASLFDAADHCSPGEYYTSAELQAAPAYGGIAIECDGADFLAGMANGIGDTGAQYMRMFSIALPQAMQVGASSAVSKELESAVGGDTGFQIEFWAATSACGTTGTVFKFSEQVVTDTGVYCGSITPDTAYTHVIEVVRPVPSSSLDGLYHFGTTVCPRGSCP